MSEFIHLHNHTHYSLLDAACTPIQLITAAKENGQESLALTDHGVMFGCMEFILEAKKEGIKPIVGFEAYMATGSRFDMSSGKARSKKKNYYHILLLAKDNTGYKNLMKLTSLAHIEGFYYKPRIDRELIEKYNEGIIACSGCINGVVNAHIVDNNYDAAYESAVYYHQLFGDDFYIELQNHSLPEDELILKQASEIARKLNIKIVATNDVHYIHKSHAIPHNVYLNINKDTGNSTSGQINIRDLRYRTPEMYYKSTEEMKTLFRDFPDSISNTLEIAEKCNISFEKTYFMPHFPIPADTEASNLEEYLVELTNEGLRERYGDYSQEIDDRAKFELDLILKMGYAGYFLIVYDFIKAARELGVRVGPGRGSAAGSIVAFALKITNVDPLKYGLLFERFLNPERVSMPDIDIDFADVGREKVIDYVKKKYGENSVAQIITFGTLSSRAVLKDVGRVLGIHHTDINAITAKIPVILGKVMPLNEALELPDLKAFRSSEDPQIKELIEYSLMLEGFFRNRSTHAAGVVITPGDVSDYVPLYYHPEMKNMGAGFATQYDMKKLEKAGLIKMDFLGLKTLTIIDNTLGMIEKNYGKNIDIDSIDLDDEKTYEIFSSGNTLGIFQFESSGMKEYLRQLKPVSIEEIMAMNALYRPGPMEFVPEYINRKYGKKKIEYLVPEMQKTLEETFGIIVYQEQVMQLARDIAGFTLGQADILRRAMGKKDSMEMEKLKPIFVQGAVKNNIIKKDADEIFELIYKFARYGFNKSHSLVYSIVAYQTAWLKSYYPAEFIAANMTNDMSKQDKIVQFIEDAKRIDITVLPPDVNSSDATFKAVNNTIIFGMAAIKNVGIPAVESIIKAREEKPFTSFFDFTARVDTHLINKRSLEALVCAGSFDTLYPEKRAALFNSIEQALEYARAVQAGNQSGSLFGESSPTFFIEPKLPEIPEWDERERLKKEKESLNFYISGHPMNRFAPFVNSLSSFQLGEKDNPLIGGNVKVCGIVSDIRTRLDRRNNPIAFIRLEDFTGYAECIFWSDAYSRFHKYLRIDEVILCNGRSESDGELLKIVVDDVLLINDAANKLARGYNIWVDLEQTDETIIHKVERMCNDLYSHNTIVFNLFNKTTRYKQTYRVDNVNIAISEQIVGRLVEMFGRNNVRLLTN